MNSKNHLINPNSLFYNILLATIAFCALFQLSGCSSFTPLGGSTVRLLYATGVGQASPKNASSEKSPDGPVNGVVISPDSERENPLGADAPEWTMDTLEVETTATVPKEATSYVESLMLARQEVRDKAWREMAAKIAALPSKSENEKVGDLLKARPQDQKEVERMIRSAEIVSVNDDLESGIIKITTKMKLEPVALLLFEESETPAKDAKAGKEEAKAEKPVKSGNVDIPKDPQKREAFDLARENAKKAILGSLQHQFVRGRKMVGDMMKQSPDAAQRVELALEYVEVKDIRFPKADTCEVDLMLNVAPIMNNLRRLEKRAK